MTVSKKQRRLGRGLEALLSATPESNETQDENRIGVETEPVGITEATIPRADSPGSGTSPAGLPIPLRRAESTEADYDDGPDYADPDSGTETSGRLFQLNVYEIDDNPFQPRREFSEPEIASLSESLKEHDMLQPVLVRRIDNRFQLISGERRLRAAIQAGWSTVPAQIREADDRLVAELAIVENLQRKDLNPLEKALSFKRYIEEHDCKQENLASRLKIDRSTVANLMRLLELPRVVQDALRTDIVTAGHARALLPLPDSQTQINFCNRIQQEGWSVRETERLVKEHLESLGQSNTQKSKKKRTKSDQIQSLENEMRMSLGTKVEIKQSSRGRGQIVVHFNNADEFDRLQQMMKDGQEREAA